MPKTMNVRQANLSDLDQLVPLFDQYRMFYDKTSDLSAANLFLEERIRHEESVIFVSEGSNRLLLGFVQLYPIFSSTRMQRLWLLNDLFVLPEQRGKGISKQLIDAAKLLCRNTNACSMLLETSKSNAIGNQLYPDTGFVLDEDNNYYTWTSPITK